MCEVLNDDGLCCSEKDGLASSGFIVVAASHPWSCPVEQRMGPEEKSVGSVRRGASIAKPGQRRSALKVKVSFSTRQARRRLGKVLLDTHLALVAFRAAWPGCSLLPMRTAG